MKITSFISILTLNGNEKKFAFFIFIRNIYGQSLIESLENDIKVLKLNQIKTYKNNVILKFYIYPKSSKINFFKFFSVLITGKNFKYSSFSFEVLTNNTISL